MTVAEKSGGKIENRHAAHGADKNNQGSRKEVMQFMQLRVSDYQQNEVKQHGYNNSGKRRKSKADINKQINAAQN